MRSRERRTTRTLIAALAGISLVVAACGSDDTASNDTTASDVGAEVETTDAPPTDDTVADDAPVDDTTPDTVAGDEAPVDEPAADAVPERIVSLSPTHTETLFAIGAGDQIIAVDDYSNFPEEALALPNELSGFEPNIEAIAAFEPDLVVLSGDGAVEQLESLGIATWVGTSATNFDEVYEQIEQLGAATGNIGGAAELVSSMTTSIDELVAQVPEGGTGLTYFHEISADLYSATSDTFIGQQYELLGLTNIAGSSDDNDGTQYPQLNAEVVIEANPDLIFLSDTKCCDETAETVAARDGWGEIAAVQAGNVIEMDDDIASRWGPRIVDYMQAVIDAVAKVAVPA